MRKINTSKHAKKQPISLLNQRKLILIACCGITEGLYFQNLRRELRGISQLTVKVIPKNPAKILENVLRLADFNYFDHVWLIVDKDDFPNIQGLISKAKRQKINISYSNPCFELWIYLHFEYLQSPIPRADYAKRIEKSLRKQRGLKKYCYNKSDRNLSYYISANRKTAISRAERLLNYWASGSNINADTNDPSTNLFELIKSLFPH